MRYIALRVCASLFSLLAALLVGTIAFLMLTMGSFISGITFNGAGVAPLFNQTLWLGGLLAVFALFCLWQCLVMTFCARMKMTVRTLVGLAKSQVLPLVIAIGIAVFEGNTDNLRFFGLLFFVLLIQSLLMLALKADLQRGRLAGREREESGGMVREVDVRFEPARALKSFMKFFIMWPTAAIGVLLLACVAVNAFDQKLSQQAQDMMQVPANPYRPGDNLFIAMLGIDAPPGQDPIVYAEAKIRKFDEQAASFASGSDASTGQGGAPQGMPFYGNADPYNPVKVSVWRAAAAHRGEVGRLVEANAIAYRRYAALHDVPGFFDPTADTFNGNGGFIPIPLQIRNLYLASLALRLQSGSLAQQKEVLAALRSDIVMLRQILVESDRLVWKATASAYLQTDYFLLADMAADKSLDVINLAPEMDQLLSLSKLEDWQVGSTFAREFRRRIPIWKTAHAGTDAAARPRSVLEKAKDRLTAYFLKVNATANLSARDWADYAKAVDAKPQELSASYDDYRARRGEASAPGIGYVYNPTGKLLESVDMTSAAIYYDFALRGYDAAAVQRLARLVYEIRRQHVPAARVAAFIKQHPEWASHPVDGAAFSWNEATHEIAIHSVGTWKDDKRFSVVL
jgi:hypothetical protein